MRGSCGRRNNVSSDDPSGTDRASEKPHPPRPPLRADQGRRAHRHRHGHDSDPAKKRRQYVFAARPESSGSCLGHARVEASSDETTLRRSPRERQGGGQTTAAVADSAPQVLARRPRSISTTFRPRYGVTRQLLEVAQNLRVVRSIERAIYPFCAPVGRLVRARVPAAPGQRAWALDRVTWLTSWRSAGFRS